MTKLQERPLLVSDRLVGVPVAADALGVSQQTVRRMVKRGTLHPVRLVEGGRWRFRVSELDALIQGEETT
jgi:excisionase family DNA binding protein